MSQPDETAVIETLQAALNVLNAVMNSQDFKDALAATKERRFTFTVEATAAEIAKIVQVLMPAPAPGPGG